MFRLWFAKPSEIANCKGRGVQKMGRGTSAGQRLQFLTILERRWLAKGLRAAPKCRLSRF